MKISNVKFTAVAYYSNGKFNIRYFVTEKAVSNWANAQYRKDENVLVEVYSGCGVGGDRLCTYHA